MSYKILLVDDVNFFLDLMKNYLSVLDSEILTAHNGREALSIMENDKVDLLITDYEMPEMDGYELVLKISQYERLKSIPVIVASAHLNDELMERFLKLGVKAFIKKPFNDLDFVKTVDSHLIKDRRMKERVLVQLPCFFGFGDVMERGVIFDISEGGLYLSGQKIYKENTYFEIKFIIPNETKTIKLWGRVAWVNVGEKKIKPKYPDGMGIEFSGVSREQIQVIKAFIERVKSGYQS